MTFGVSRDRGLFEWSGTSLSAVFAQKSNIFSARIWIMLFDIIRFNQFALDLLADEDKCVNDPSDDDRGIVAANESQHQQSIGQYLDQEHYSEAFRNDYLIPMTAAVWSTAPDKASLEFPVVTLVRFMWNHHLLSTIASRPQWMTIPGGSQKYIDAVLADLPKDRLHIGKPVTTLGEDADNHITVTLADGSRDSYDHVIVATHGDQALELVHDTASSEEREILSGFTFSTNTAILHSDVSVGFSFAISAFRPVTCTLIIRA